MFGFYEKVKTTWLLIFFILLIIISIGLYFNAPFSYSYEFCLVCFYLFLIPSLVVICKSIQYFGTVLNFDVLFTLPFFYTNYIYGLILYNINPNFSLFRLEFNDAYICKGMALCTVGYCAYALGRCCILKERKNEDCYKLDLSVVNIDLLQRITIVLLFILILFMSANLDKNYTDEGGLDFGGLGNYLYTVVFILIYYLIGVKFEQANNDLLYLVKKNWVLCIFTFIAVIFLLIIGSRTIPMRIALLFYYCYTVYIGRIGGVKLFLLFVVGVFLMYYVGANRLGYQAESISDNPLIEAGNELIINNRSLYVLMEYADNSGFTYGRTFLMNILSIVPFAQSLFLYVFGFNEGAISSAFLVTHLYYDDRNEDAIGLGTNLIGDTYVAFGLFGVIVLLFLLGKTVNYLSGKKDLLSVLFFSMFFINAVYYTRSSIFTPMREIAWIYLFYFISTYKYKKKRV